MKRTLIIAVTCMLLLGMTGLAAATHGADKTQRSTGSEAHPDCEDGQEAISTDKVPLIPISGDVEVLGNQVAYVCTGEQWDGQDQNTKESDPGLVANANDLGNVYVNPLGDCSGWDSSATTEGCPGGVDRPTLTQPVHLRVTGDAAGDDTGVFVNEETFAVGRSATAVNYNSATGDGYVAIYLEDHSDQVVCPSHDGCVGPDGNMIAYFVDYLQGGKVAEGDCTQSEYAQGGSACPRDNTAATVEVHTGWLTGSGQAADPGALMP